MFGKQYGNVFIGVQPTFGYEGDPMRLLFSRSASPHHGFAAYYTFLERIFQARAGALRLPRCSGSWRRISDKVFAFCSCSWQCGLSGLHGCSVGVAAPISVDGVPLRALTAARFARRRTRCCTSARTGRWSSCRGSRWA